MKKASSIMAAPAGAALLLLLLGLASCSTYSTKTAVVQDDLINGRFTEASNAIDSNSFLTKQRNRLLYLLEKGKMEHLAGNYTESNKLFEQAYLLIDDQIKTSTGQAIASKFTNPMAEPYKGEDFEKVTLHYYMALNYFFLGQPQEALVEAKRINIKLLQLNDKYANNKNKYSRDAFSQILQGIIYESTGDINNAFIAYRNAEEIYTANKGEYFGVAMPAQLKQDLLRTSAQLGFTQEYNGYLKQFGLPPKTPAPRPAVMGEAVIFWENGLGPAKDQIIITASGAGSFFYGTYMDDNIAQDILIPIPTGVDIGYVNAIAIPKYTRRPSYYTKASIAVNGKEQFFEPAQDFYPIAKQCLKDRMLRETIELVLRFATKKSGSALLESIAKQTMGKDGAELVRLGTDAAGALTEKADTRNWQSLPATISYSRVPLNDSETKFTLKKYGPQGIVDTDTLTVPYRPGLQIVNYFDLGRTQVTPIQKTADTLAAQKKVIEVPKAVAGKYDVWTSMGNGLSYKVSWYAEVLGGKAMYGKKIAFKSERAAAVKVTYTITERPLSKEYKEVSLDEFENFQEAGTTTDNLYFTLQDKLKPMQETTGWYPFVQKTADFYVTIIKTEDLPQP